MADNITMETDWGAKGAQLTGAQVQAFIKGCLIELQERVTTIESQTTKIGELAELLSNWDASMEEVNPALQTYVNSKVVELQQADKEFSQKLQEIIASNTSISNALNDKADKSDTYTKREVQQAIAEMQITGNVGVMKLIPTPQNSADATTEDNKFVYASNSVDSPVSVLSAKGTIIEQTKAGKMIFKRGLWNPTNPEAEGNESTFEVIQNIPVATTNADGVMSKEDKKTLDSLPDPRVLIGTTSISNINAVPTSHRQVIASINATASFAFESPTAFEAGREVHVLIKNTASTKISVVIPNSGIYVTDNDTLSIEPSATAEINAISDGVKVYLRSAE